MKDNIKELLEHTIKFTSSFFIILLTIGLMASIVRKDFYWLLFCLLVYISIGLSFAFGWSIQEIRNTKIHVKD